MDAAASVCLQTFSLGDFYKQISPWASSRSSNVSCRPQFLILFLFTDVFPIDLNAEVSLVTVVIEPVDQSL